MKVVNMRELRVLNQLYICTVSGVEHRSGEDSPKFTIEANVGKDVAAQLVLGGKVRIGKNGKRLLGEETNEADDDSVFYDK